MLRYLIGGLFAAGVLIFFFMLGQSLLPPQGDARSLARGSVASFQILKTPASAPDTSFVDAEGKPVTLADFRGKVLLINLWATWCGPCKTEMPTLDALQAEMGGENFQVLAISLDRDGPEVAQQFLDSQKLGNLTPYNEQSGRILGALAMQSKLPVPGLPATFLIDRNSRIVGRLSGPAEWDTPEARALMHHFIEE